MTIPRVGDRVTASGVGLQGRVGIVVDHIIAAAGLLVSIRYPDDTTHDIHVDNVRVDRKKSDNSR